MHHKPHHHQNKILHLTCKDCGNKWTVAPATVYDGVAYYGSDADFCPACDGAPVHEHDHEEVKK